MWLERSRDAVIDVRIGYHPQVSRNDLTVPEATEAEQDISEVLKTIFRNQSRIGSIELFGSSLSARKKMVSSPIAVHDLSALTALALNYEFPFTTDPTSRYARRALISLPIPSTTQVIARSLRTLTLTSIRESAMQQAGFLAMLQHCPNLEELKLATWAPIQCKCLRRSPTEGPPPVSLEKLELFEFDVYHYRDFLGLIKAPSLKRLDVRQLGSNLGRSQLLLQDVHRLIVNSGAGETLRVVRLILAGIGLDETIAIALFQSLPNITTLETN